MSVNWVEVASGNCTWPIQFVFPPIDYEWSVVRIWYWPFEVMQVFEGHFGLGGRSQQTPNALNVEIRFVAPKFQTGFIALSIATEMALWMFWKADLSRNTRRFSQNISINLLNKQVDVLYRFFDINPGRKFQLEQVRINYQIFNTRADPSDTDNIERLTDLQEAHPIYLKFSWLIVIFGHVYAQETRAHNATIINFTLYDSLIGQILWLITHDTW